MAIKSSQLHCLCGLALTKILKTIERTTVSIYILIHSPLIKLTFKPA